MATSQERRVAPLESDPVLRAADQECLAVVTDMVDRSNLRMGRAVVVIPGHVDNGLAGTIISYDLRRAPSSIEMILDRDARSRRPETFWTLSEIEPSPDGHNRTAERVLM